MNHQKQKPPSADDSFDSLFGADSVKSCDVASDVQLDDMLKSGGDDSLRGRGHEDACADDSLRRRGRDSESGKGVISIEEMRRDAAAFQAAVTSIGPDMLSAPVISSWDLRRTRDVRILPFR